MDQLTEDHAVPEEEDELPGPGPGGEGGVTGGDDPPLVQPAQALPPHWLHVRGGSLGVSYHNITSSTLGTE